jgi:hypothetical protein
MRTKVTLVLLFLNVALFFFIFKFERNWRTERASLEARRRVLGAEAADIRTLTVKNAAGTVYALTRTGETWQLTQPLDWPANPAAVARIVSDLQFLEHETSFAVADLKANGQSLADYGLDQPKLTVEFGNGAAPDSNVPVLKTTLRLGDTTKIGNRLYLLSPDGQRIHVVSRALADSLALPVEQLRADTLLTIPVFEARSLRIQSTARVALRRESVQRWTFDTPIVARASTEETERTLGALGALRAKAFIVENPPATLPSASPAFRITIEGNNRRETLLLGTPVPVPPAAPAAPNPSLPPTAPPPLAIPKTQDYYAQIEGRPALFTVAIPSGEKSLKETLDRAQETLREKRVLDFDPRAVTAITLKAPNTPGEPTLTLQRLEAPANSVDLAPWQIIRREPGTSAPQTVPADRALVQRLLEQLRLLSAQVFASDAPTAADLERWGFARPEREISLTLTPQPGLPAQSAAAKPPLVLKLGLANPPDLYAYASVSGAAFVYAVSPDLLRLETTVNASAWRERLIRELPAGARIVALKLTDLANSKSLLDLTLDEAGNLPPNTPEAKPIAAVLAGLRSLRAKNFPQDGYTEKVPLLGEERPWRYRLDATLALPGAVAGAPAPVTSLFFSERFGGTLQVAGSEEFNTVFELEQPLVDALWALTFRTDPGPVLPKP